MPSPPLRTPPAFAKNWALAARLGLDGAVLSWDEVTPFAQELFYPTPKQSGRAGFRQTKTPRADARRVDSFSI